VPPTYYTAITDVDEAADLLPDLNDPRTHRGRRRPLLVVRTELQLHETLHQPTVDDAVLRAFCREHGIRSLRLFGSATRNELRDDSDIDLLVEFEPGRTPGLLGVAKLELELQELLGREVDLRTVGDLSPHFRDAVVAAARALYVAA
jgi:uncharacterized protein